MAATDAALAGSDGNPAKTPARAALLMAALALPGIQASAQAQEPESGMIGYRYLHYRDGQPGLDRIMVNSPSLVFLLPIAGEWSLEGGTITDNISGASPRYHTAISGASKMMDVRHGTDIKLTRYFSRGSLSMGAAKSVENDYDSNAQSLSASISSEDRNTTWQMGIGGSQDRINPVTHVVVGEHKHSSDLLLGVTQVLTAGDIAQLTFTRLEGHGYYSDPYKIFDHRPRERSQTTMTVKWNHYLQGFDATSRFSYSYYADNYHVEAHTFAEEYVAPLRDGWTLTPSLRFYTQSKASFYVDPVYAFGLAPLPPGFPLPPNRNISQDQRLSAFGAITAGIKIAKTLGENWSADVTFEHYEQKGSWRLFGDGSPGLAPLSAHWVQVGLYRRW